MRNRQPIWEFHKHNQFRLCSNSQLCLVGNLHSHQRPIKGRWLGKRRARLPRLHRGPCLACTRSNQEAWVSHRRQQGLGGWVSRTKPISGLRWALVAGQTQEIKPKLQRREAFLTLFVTFSSSEMGCLGSPIGWVLKNADANRGLSGESSRPRGSIRSGNCQSNSGSRLWYSSD